MEQHFDTERSGWFSELSSTVLKGAGEHPALASHQYRADLGDIDITQAVLVTLIAERHLNGETPDSITKWLHPLEVFASPVPMEELSSLVREIHRRWENHSLWSLVNMSMGGTGLWDPSRVSDALTEYWTSQRAAVVPRERLRRELVGCWGLGVEIPELIDAWLERPLGPFDDHVENFDIFDGEERKVAGLGRACLHSTLARKSSRQWAESITWDYSRQTYLVRFGRQIRQLREARVFLDLSMKTDGFPENLIIPSRRVRELMAEQEQRHRRTLSALTAHEVFLLGDRDEDHLFTEACATVYIAQNVENTREDPERTSVGMWGKVPWGSIVVRGEEQVAAARKVLGHRVLKVGFSLPAGASASPRLFLDMRPLNDAGVDAGFTFSPREAHDLCRLLLIIQRRSFCLEFVELRWNEELEHDEAFPIGTYNLPLDGDTVDKVLPWALSRLRRLLPKGPMSDDQLLSFIRPGHGPLAELLRRPTHLDPWS